MYVEFYSESYVSFMLYACFLISFLLDLYILTYTLIDIPIVPNETKFPVMILIKILMSCFPSSQSSLGFVLFVEKL